MCDLYITLVFVYSGSILCLTLHHELLNTRCSSEKDEILIVRKLVIQVREITSGEVLAEGEMRLVKII